MPRRPVLVLLLIWLCALPLASAAMAQGAPFTLHARPATVLARTSLGGGWDARAYAKPAERAAHLVSVIVKLADPPLAAYAGGLPGLPATAPQATGARRLDASAPASQGYLAYLTRRQDDFAASARALIPQARLAARYRVVFGGVAMILPESQIGRLAGLPGVAWVQRDELRQADTERSPRFIGADVLWGALAANPALGDGGQDVVIGVIDTGIWPEHPSFADDGSYPPPPARWRGICEPPEDSSPPIVCNNKLIGARTSLFIYKFLIGLNPGEFDSARDNEGHGTHTASTAAGNAGVPATVFGQPRGLVSGVAPRARIAAYKALGNAGGFSSDLVSAIEQAVADGVDVINYSVGSIAAPSPYETPDSLAFLDAYRAGVFVAVSAGNSGPDAGTVGSPANAPWVASVAASTLDRRFEGRVTLTAGNDTLTLAGASITGGAGPRPLVDAARLNAPQCDRPLPAQARGAIVICQRGGNARVEKSSVVRAAGGAGMILYNPEPRDVVSDNHWLPTVHLDAPAGQRLLAFTQAHSRTAVLAAIAPAQPIADAQQGDIIAAFSARGPLADAQLGISKPDMAAPGVQILAGHTPAPNQPAAGPQGELFQAIAGTSMAAPHVAGAGALLKALHPEWTPGQIKSALMTTAWTQLRREDGSGPATPYDMGAGRIDLRVAGDPGLTLDVSADAFEHGQAHLPHLNYPSISLPTMPGRISVTRMVTSVLDVASTWLAEADAPPGAQISISPRVIEVPARASATFTVTIDAGALPDGAYFGRVWLRSGARALHLPVSFVRRQPPVALEQRCDPNPVIRRKDMQCMVVVTNRGAADAGISIRATFARGLSVREQTLVGAIYDRPSRLMRFDGSLPGYRPPRIDLTPDPEALPFGYTSLGSLGVPPNFCDSLCDETAITFVSPPFSYLGQTYDRVTMVSNGYLIVGSRNEIRIFNQDLPDPAPPNNVIAPYWTDLDLPGSIPNDPGGGAWYAAYVTTGPDSPTWFVAEWTDVPRYGRSPAVSHHSFQVWIETGSERIHIVYGPNSPAEDKLTVGAENADGTIGGNYYLDQLTGDGANGVGTPPKEGDILRVAAAPERLARHSISFLLRGKRAGEYQHMFELTSGAFEGVNVSALPISVIWP